MLKDYAGNEPADPPADDQVEITFFGPGFGESILVHLGCGEWIVVDSCVPPGSHIPAPLWYLEKIDVDPAEAVKLVIATHWHDDHIRGLGRVFEACTSAQFCTSQVIGTEEFIDMALHHQTRNHAPFPSGCREILSVMKVLGDREEKGAPFSAPKKAAPDRILYRLLKEKSGHGCECSVFALSPSDKEINLFLRDIANRLDKLHGERSRAPCPESNLGAVVVMVCIGDHALLLGSDLEEHGDPERGWTAIVNSGSRPRHTSPIFKIPHHGSSGAHCEAVWEHMLPQLPIAVVTPWNRGSKLPQPEDVERILGFTPFGLVTSTVSLPARKKFTPEIEKTFRDLNESPKPLQPRMGAVRLRNKGSDLSTNWHVKFFGSATQLEYVHS